MIEIDGELQGVKRTLDNVQKLTPKAVRSALSRAGTGVKTEAGRKIRQTYTIKARDVSQTIKVTRSGSLGLRLTSRGPNIPLIRFKTTPSSRPDTPPKVLKAGVKKGRKKPIPGAFVANVGGHTGVLKRLGQKRLPINELYGPAAPVMLGSKGTREHLEAETKRRVEDRLDHEINRMLGG